MVDAHANEHNDEHDDGAAEARGGSFGTSELPEPPEPPPTLLGRGAYAVVFVAIVLAGVFGGIIGWGITDLGCTGDCAVVTTLGATAGATGAAVGVGIIGVLVLRAMSEWRPTQPKDREQTSHPASVSRRKPSA